MAQIRRTTSEYNSIALFTSCSLRIYALPFYLPQSLFRLFPPFPPQILRLPIPEPPHLPETKLSQTPSPSLSTNEQSFPQKLQTVFGVCAVKETLFAVSAADKPVVPREISMDAAARHARIVLVFIVFFLQLNDCGREIPS